MNNGGRRSSKGCLDVQHPSLTEQQVLAQCQRIQRRLAGWTRKDSPDKSVWELAGQWVLESLIARFVALTREQGIEVRPAPIGSASAERSFPDGNVVAQVRGELSTLLNRCRFTLREDSPAKEDSQEPAIGPGVLARAYQALVLSPLGTTRGQRLSGAYYTPREVVRLMCRDALARSLAARMNPVRQNGSESGDWLSSIHALLDHPLASEMSSEERAALNALFPPEVVRRLRSAVLSTRAWDPAVGAGEFLLGLAREMTEAAARLDLLRHGRAAIDVPGYRFRIARRIVECCLAGNDIQPLAVRLCQLRLGCLLAADHSGKAPHLHRRLQLRVECCDSLTDPSDTGPQPHIIIGNPPYLSARNLLQQHGRRYKEALTGKFLCARGAYDAYALFGELALGSVAPRGVVSLLVPNKLLVAEYAQPLRRLCATRSIRLIEDLSRSEIFREVAVYPVILVVQNEPPLEHSRVHIAEPTECETSLASVPGRLVLQRWNFPADGSAWSLGRAAEPCSVAGRTLADVARLHGGVTGFSAYRLLQGLYDAADGEQHPAEDDVLPLVVTGGIDPYRVRGGPATFMKSQFQRPMFRPDTAHVSSGKLRLFRTPKIVIGGMGKRIEAALALEPLAVGVQVYCVTDWQLNPLFLLGLLNSVHASRWYRQHFSGKQLSGGYLSMNKSQLAAIPVPITSANCERHVAEHVRKLLAHLDAGRITEAGGCEAKIDEALAPYFPN